MVARPAKSPGEIIALLTEMGRKMKLVEDVTGEEVSEMRARSALVGMLDPVTRQHTAMSHSKSYGALKQIAQEFANNSTTGQEAMQIGRVEAGATAPTTAWPPSVAETSEDTWEEYGAINAIGSTVLDLQRIRSRVLGLSQWQGQGQRQGQLRQGQGRIRMGHEQPRREQGQQLRDVQGRWKGEQPGLSWSRQGVPEGRRQVWRERTLCGKCCTCGGDHFARDCSKGGGKGRFRALEAQETWEEKPLVERARVLSSPREAPPEHAGLQRVPRDLRKKFMTCADMNCNCKGGHQQKAGEVPPPQDYKQKGRMENGR